MSSESEDENRDELHTQYVPGSLRHILRIRHVDALKIQNNLHPRRFSGTDGGYDELGCLREGGYWPTHHRLQSGGYPTGSVQEDLICTYADDSGSIRNVFINGRRAILNV